MNNEEIIINGVEESTTEIVLNEEVKEVIHEEIVEHISVEGVTPVSIATQGAFPAIGESNSNLLHSNLHGRENSNQHPITSITGLREELNKIESLQTIYSDKTQQANYYIWHDNNPLRENRDGLFVSINTDGVKICDGNVDIFGVTVSEAGFIGNQQWAEATGAIKVGRDGQYGLVVCSGMAAVRCERTVTVGDYVVSNVRGEAKKSNGNYGYLVTALSEVNGVKYAVISLATPSTIAKTVSDSVEDLSGRMTTAEYNITSVANVADSAYSLAQDAKENAEVNSEYLEEKIEEVLDRMDNVDTSMGNLEASVGNACESAALAKTIAEGAVSSAETIRREAVDEANKASASVKDLMEDLSPITEWVDPDNSENVGAHYYTEYIQNGINNKVDIETFESKTEEGFSAIERSAKHISSLMHNIDKYCVGEFSQAYNLSIEDATSILSEGIVYVPTAHRTESYGSYTQPFSKGYYYTWNSDEWTPSQSGAVSFSNVYVIGTSNTPYWVVTDADVVEGEITYDLGGLYLWENNAWVKVASVADNTLSRTVSVIKQTSDSISAEVIDARGSYAGLGARITNNEALVESSAQWAKGKSEDGEELYNIATIKQQADADGSSLTLVVADTEGNKVLKGASIVLGQNEEDSYIQLEADKIDFTCDNYSISADKINFEGSRFSSTMSQTYSTKGETATAKQEAINAAADDVDEKLKDYSTTTQMQSEIDQKADNITLSVSQTYSTKGETAGLESRIKSAESAIELNSDNIALKVSKNGVISSINQSSETITINASKINLSGYVTVTGLTGGTTTIDGECIKTGNIDADRIGADTLSAISADLGTVTAGVIQSTNYNVTSGFQINLNNQTIIAPYFTLSEDGKISATGGEIGGFTINDNSISNGILGNDDSIYISNIGTNGTVSDEILSNWILTAGKNFGVTTTGDTYLNNVFAKNGQIGGISLKSGINITRYIGNIDSILINNCTALYQGNLTSSNNTNTLSNNRFILCVPPETGDTPSLEAFISFNGTNVPSTNYTYIGCSSIYTMNLETQGIVTNIMLLNGSRVYKTYIWEHKDTLEGDNTIGASCTFSVHRISKVLGAVATVRWPINNGLGGTSYSARLAVRIDDTTVTVVSDHDKAANGFYCIIYGT